MRTVASHSGVSLLPSSRNDSEDHQAQIDQLKAEYELKLSSLQEQYGTEHANRTKLEQDILKLQSDYEAQIAEAKVINAS